MALRYSHNIRVRTALNDAVRLLRLIDHLVYFVHQLINGQYRIRTYDLSDVSRML